MTANPPLCWNCSARLDVVPREKRKLMPGEAFVMRLVLERIGLVELSKQTDTLPIGYIESQVGLAWDKTNPDERYQDLMRAAHQCARSMRKPINDWDEYAPYAGRVLNA